MIEYSIRKATPEDAAHIAEAIVMAVGDEITQSFAGKDHTVQDVKNLFSRLAQADNSQYSYKNTLVAVTPSDEVMGLIISYDGALLHPLRETFIKAAKEALGYDLVNLADETSDDEVYLDTLAVYSAFRGNGVASALLNAAAEQAKTLNKPVGLLVDKTNHRARRLYESLGFRQVDERPFAGEMMDHLQKELNQ